MNIYVIQRGSNDTVKKDLRWFFNELFELIAVLLHVVQTEISTSVSEWGL